MEFGEQPGGMPLTKAETPHHERIAMVYANAMSALAELRSTISSVLQNQDSPEKAMVEPRPAPRTELEQAIVNLETLPSAIHSLRNDVVL